VRFSLRQKTRLAALRVRGDVLVLQTLLWADEVREASFAALDEPVKISDKELELSASLVESFSADFDPDQFVDEYQQELRTLIDAKLEKGDALDTSETFGEKGEKDAGGEVIDLMAALKASVERSRAARARTRRWPRPRRARPPKRPESGRGRVVLERLDGLGRRAGRLLLLHLAALGEVVPDVTSAVPPTAASRIRSM
jgi:DNA end-binding protein Ku